MPVAIIARDTSPPGNAFRPDSSSAAAIPVTAVRSAAATGAGRNLNDRGPAHTLNALAASKAFPAGPAQNRCGVPDGR